MVALLNKIKHIVNVLILIVIFTGNCNSQESTPQDTASFKNTFIGVPLAFYTPQTKWGIGLAGTYLFRFKEQTIKDRPSQIQFIASVTQKKQVLIFMPFQIFWDDNKNNFNGELGYYLYNFPFFGVGIDSKPKDEESYDVNFPRLRLNMTREVRPSLYIGGRLAIDGMKIKNIEDGGILESSKLVGSPSGGTIVGIGPEFIFDNRENIFWPTSATLVELNHVIFNHAIGSSFNYGRSKLEVSQYFQFKWKHVLALNSRIETTTGSAPFFNLSTLGGAKRLRGYIGERFIDNNTFLAQFEYRARIYKSFGATLFGGIGTASGDLNSLFTNKYVSAAGLGLRYMVDKEKKVNIRVDWGVTPEGSNFYITIGEAF